MRSGLGTKRRVSWMLSYLDPENMLHVEELRLRLNVLCDQALDGRIQWSWFFCLSQYAPGDAPNAHPFAVGEPTSGPSSVYVFRLAPIILNPEYRNKIARCTSEG